MQVSEMEDEHLESYKAYLLKIRKESKIKLDEVYTEQMRRVNERKANIEADGGNREQRVCSVWLSALGVGPRT